MEKEANNLVSIHEATARVTVAWTHARGHLFEEEKAKTMLYSNPDQVASADHVLLQPFPIMGVRVGGTASRVRNSRQVCSL